MDLIERLIGHDRWTTCEVLRRCAELTNAQLDQPCYIDHRTVRATLDHMIWNVETWTDLMLERPIDRTTIRSTTLDGLSERHARAGERFHALARRLADEQRLEASWTDVLDNPPKQKTYGGAICHVITHNMHYRAQVLYMLDQHGLTNLPEGDLLGWEMRYRFE